MVTMALTSTPTAAAPASMTSVAVETETGPMGVMTGVMVASATAQVSLRAITVLVVPEHKRVLFIGVATIITRTWARGR